MSTFGSGYNLPPGCYEHHLPGWNDPDPIVCECGAEVFPGEECERCGVYEPSDAERAEDAEIERAEAMREEAHFDPPGDVW